jgi:zinc transporter ZupT
MIGRQHSATASIDTSRTLTIEGSPLKMFAVAALGALLTLLGIAVAVPLFPGMENSYVQPCSSAPARC